MEDEITKLREIFAQERNGVRRNRHLYEAKDLRIIALLDNLEKRLAKMEALSLSIDALLDNETAVALKRLRAKEFPE